MSAASRAHERLFDALASNRGLQNLDLGGQPINDVSWTLLVCREVRQHATLQTLNVNFTGDIHRIMSIQTLRTCALVDIRQLNGMLHMLILSKHEHNECIFKTFRPRLLVNLYRQRLRLIQGSPEAIRPSLLGRVISTVAYDPALVWIFLVDSVDLVRQYTGSQSG